MKKIIISFIGIFTVIGSSFGTEFILKPETRWWENFNPMCVINNSTCYRNMVGDAYCSSTGDSDCWDESGNCWGRKYICANALVSPSDENKLLNKSEIASARYISSDFNIDEMSKGGDCFGIRKTYNNGIYASVNNERVRVWCRGILDNPNEELPNGDLMLLAEKQPTCSELADIEYAALKTNTCWGKKYSRSEYYIDCHNNTLEPHRFIVLNGVEYDAIEDKQNSLSESEIKARFQSMYDEAQIQHKKYFK